LGLAGNISRPVIAANAAIISPLQNVARNIDIAESIARVPGECEVSIDQLVALILANGGPMGILVAYLIYRDSCDRKERQQHAKDQLEIQERDIVAREKHASAFTALAMVIQGRPVV
jgi:hypothetical protein